ncbi:MAG: protein BatD [Bacteroidales bacterium]|nr:protein BatD [Bacteroidales bacterium]
MKKMLCKCSGLLAVFILFCSVALAQSEKSCKATAPAEVAVDQQFKYTVTTEKKGDVISSDFGKFEMVSGPSVGSSTSISMANGKVDQKTTYTYTYYLIGHKEGEFTIPGITISIDGRVVKSNYVVVKVVKAPKVAQQEEPAPNDSWFNWDFQVPEWPFGSNTQPQQKQDKVQVDDKIGKDDIFVKATTSQLEAYQGEAVVLTHKLYVKQEFKRYAIERANFAATNDMWLEPLDLANRVEESTETVNGKTYSVFVIKQTAVYPTKTGKLTIPKLTLVLRISVPATVKDPFWGSIRTTRRKDVTVTSNELTLKVKALPGVRSNDKTEVVGNFTISSNMNKTETYVNEPVTLVVTVSGTGNLHHITAEDLGITFPADCDVTYPRITGRISAKNDIVTGSKTFRYTIIPRTEGTFLIPGAAYNYYNYDMGGYKTISSPDYQLEVHPARTNAPSDRQDSDKESKPKSNVKTYKI